MELPITHKQSLQVHEWLQKNYGDKIAAAVLNTPFSPELLSAIVSQETAYVWLNWIGLIPDIAICGRCIFDASGDYPNTTRSAFPQNTLHFRSKYGDDITNMLIGEANKTRSVRGYTPQEWVYKGYGLFQFDLAHIQTDEDFFVKALWYSFDECLSRLLKELNQKYNGDLWDCIRKYNGSGQKAFEYRDNVMQFYEWINEFQ